MRIEQRLGLGFGIIICLLTGMSVFVFFSLSGIANVDRMVTIHNQNREHLDRVKKYVGHWFVTMEDVKREKVTSSSDYQELLKASIGKKLNELNWEVYDAEIVGLRNEIINDFQGVAALYDSVQMHPAEGNNESGVVNEGGVNELHEALKIRKNNLANALAVLDEKITAAKKQAGSSSVMAEKIGWFSIYIVAPITLVFCIGYAFFIIRGIVNPLNMLVKTLKRVSDGSYDEKLGIKSSFETEGLFHVFNNMMLKLGEMNNKLEQAHKASKIFDAILSNTRDMIFVVDKENRIEYVNNAVLNECGPVLGKYCHRVICHQETPCQQCKEEVVSKGQTVKTERSLNGKVYDTVIVPFIQSDKNIYKLEIMRDVTEYSSLHDEIERLSVTDGLTGLYTRKYFEEQLEHEVLRARRFRHGLNLLLINIDKFEHFNDTYGRTEGDKVIQRLGRLLKEQVRKGVDMPCRYKGAEFAVLLPETAGNDAIVAAARLFKNFRDNKFPVTSGNETVQITVSIGIAEFISLNNANDLLANADNALHEAKQLGGDRICRHQ